MAQASSSFLPVSLQSSYNDPPVAYAPTKKFQLSDAEIEKYKKITQDIKTNTADAKKSAESMFQVCGNAPSVSTPMTFSRRTMPTTMTTTMPTTMICELTSPM